LAPQRNVPNGGKLQLGGSKVVCVFVCDMTTVVGRGRGIQRKIERRVVSASKQATWEALGWVGRTGGCNSTAVCRGGKREARTKFRQRRLHAALGSQYGRGTACTGPVQPAAAGGGQCRGYVGRVRRGLERGVLPGRVAGKEVWWVGGMRAHKGKVGRHHNVSSYRHSKAGQKSGWARPGLAWVRGWNGRTERGGTVVGRQGKR